MHAQIEDCMEHLGDDSGCQVWRLDFTDGWLEIHQAFLNHSVFSIRMEGEDANEFLWDALIGTTMSREMRTEVSSKRAELEAKATVPARALPRKPPF